jgi:hypothetical protein
MCAPSPARPTRSREGHAYPDERTRNAIEQYFIDLDLPLVERGNQNSILIRVESKVVQNNVSSGNLVGLHKRIIRPKVPIPYSTSREAATELSTPPLIAIAIR